MTRIAFFHPAFKTVGGAEILCLEEALCLRGMGEDLNLVTFAFDPGRWTELLQGMPVSVVPKHGWSDLLFGWSRMGKVRTRGRRAAGVLKRYDVVVAHNHPCNSMLGAAPTKAFKIWQCNEPPRTLHTREANPCLSARAAAAPEAAEIATQAWRDTLAEYDADLAARGKTFKRRAYDLENVAKLDRIYAISEFSRDNARRIYGRCLDEVLYPIVRFPEGGRTRLGIDRSGLQVLVHSRLEELKNIDSVIRGFARFQATHPGSHLHVVGDGALRGKLERLAAELLPAPAITFHGYLPAAELRAVYERCDAFALLTLDEPFGMVYPEAAAKGLLMIGPDHGGPFEILDGGRLGWCVDPFDPEALAGALEEVWSLDDGEAGRRREAAAKACRDRFSREALAPRLHRLVKP